MCRIRCVLLSFFELFARYFLRLALLKGPFSNTARFCLSLNYLVQIFRSAHCKMLHSPVEFLRIPRMNRNQRISLAKFSSYCFARCSGIRIPINAPAITPAAPPAAASVRAAAIGPATMRTPSPGMARDASPTRPPTAPNISPPDTAPMVAPFSLSEPSGAFRQQDPHPANDPARFLGRVLIHYRLERSPRYHGQRSPLAFSIATDGPPGPVFYRTEQRAMNPYLRVAVPTYRPLLGWNSHSCSKHWACQSLPRENFDESNGL